MRNNLLKRIAIVRTSSDIISSNYYNIQEVGLASALLDVGINTDIFMAGNNKTIQVDVVRRRNGNEVRIFYLPFVALPGKQAFLIGIITLLKQNDYDLIQVHEDSQVMSVIIGKLGKIIKTPVVLCQGMYANYSGFIPRTMQFMYDLIALRSLRRNICRYIAKTGEAKKYLEEKGFRDVIICGVGLQIDKFSDSDVIDWRTKFQIPNSSSILLYIGKIEKRRNVNFIIHVFKRLLKEQFDIYLFLAGDGPEMNLCKKLSEKLNVDNKTIFLGRVSQKQISSLYKSAKLFLLPSSYEIFGMVLLEAMYFNVPVIATATAGAREVIEDGVSGTLISGTDCALWCNAIKKYLLDDNYYSNTSVLAGQRIRETFLWRSVSQRYLSVYRQCFEDKKGA